MKTPSKSTSPSLGDSLKSGFAAVVIPLEIVVATLLYLYWLGSPDNFQGGDNAGHPLPGNYLAIIYKGGYIVPFLMSLLMMVITFAIERMLPSVRRKEKAVHKASSKKLRI